MIFIDHSDEVMDRLDYLLKQSLTAIGLVMEANAKKEITSMKAVDTGNLRNSINSQVNGSDSVTIGTSVEYGKYVEYGARGTEARPYLRNTLNNYISQYQSILDKYLQEMN